MKRLTCEMCGSTDLVKENGLFVCQSCGCKYSVEEAKKLMIEGTVQVEGTVKIDNSGMVETYRDMAHNAYVAGNTEEAYQYYLKVLEIDPTDYISIFYKGMCRGWQTTIATPRINEAMSAYQQAEQYIPKEIEKETKKLFAAELINLMESWFDAVQENCFEIEDFYQSNKNIFFGYQEVALKVKQNIDDIVDVILNSKSPELIKKAGTLYCNACEAICRYGIIYIDYSKKSATFPGLSSQNKQPLLRAYDNMIFEVRKFDPEFMKPDSKYGVIERLDPPTHITPSNSRITDENYRKCLEADNAINQRLHQYEIDTARKEKEEHEKQYWKLHPDEQVSYNALKDAYETQSRLADDVRKRKSEKDAVVMEYENQIAGLQSKINKANEQIAALRKKIFGKAKAQENIAQLQQEIDSYKASIAEKNEMLAKAQAEKKATDEHYREADREMQNAKKMCEQFLKERGL